MDIFDHLRKQLQIFDVVSGYLNLRKIGSYYRASCPFHSEKDASFTLTPGKEIYFCFGCKKSGDLIGFVAEMEQVSQVEAAVFLCEKYKIEVPKEVLKNTTSPENEKQLQLYQTTYKEIVEWCINQITKNNPAQNYLEKRGINKQTQSEFSLGYFSNQLQDKKLLLKKLLEKNILQKDLAEFGIFPNILSNKDQLLSPFENRIIFPILDHLGRVVGMGGRVFAEDDTRPKYYNSKEHPLFLKKKLLYGLFQARKEISLSKTIFLVEGYIDVIMMHQAGLKNCVATLGTACGIDQLQLMERFANKLFLSYDGDSAGIAASMKLADIFYETNLDVKVIKLPQNTDPAQMINSSVDLFFDAINKSTDLLSYFLSNLGQNFATLPDGQKIQRINQKVAFISKIKDPMRQYFALQKVAQITGLKIEMLQKHLAIDLSKKRTIEKPTQIIEQKNNTCLEQHFFFAQLSQVCKGLSISYLKDFMFIFQEPWKSLLSNLEAYSNTTQTCTAEQFFEELPSNLQIWSQSDFITEFIKSDIEIDEPINCKKMLQKIFLKYLKTEFVQQTKIFVSPNSTKNDRDQFDELTKKVKSIQNIIMQP